MHIYGGVYGRSKRGLCIAKTLGRPSGILFIPGVCKIMTQLEAKEGKPTAGTYGLTGGSGLQKQEKLQKQDEKLERTSLEAL